VSSARRAAFLIALLAALGPAALLSTRAGASESQRDSEALAPDRELYERIVAEAEIATERNASPFDYARHWLGQRLRGLGGRLAGSPWLALLARIVLWTLVVTVTLAALFLLVRALRGRRARRRRPRARAGDAAALPLEAEEDLLARLDDELRRGRAREALGTLWVWLGRRLAERGVARFERGVTNRELLASLRAQTPAFPALPALEELAARSERMLYREPRVNAGDVRAMRARAEEALT
jgi:hypothetical protein